MNNKTAKRIRRKLREEFPKEGNDNNYINDIRKLAKENKQLLKQSKNETQKPNTIISKRQKRLLQINSKHKKGFPLMNYSFILVNKRGHNRKHRTTFKNAGKVFSFPIKTN